jgi:Ca2+-binding EF-hand superfamily protein
LDQVLFRARRLIGQKGTRAAVDVVRNFYAADDDNDDFLDVYEFRRACQQSGLSFPPGEEALLFQACGQGSHPGVQGASVISVPQFLNSLHGDMSPERLQAVEKAWTHLGGDLAEETSSISPSVLKEKIACEQHPRVMRGELDASVVLTEFLDTFSLLAYVRGGCENGLVTFADFLAYYEVVSSAIENDAFFTLMMHRLWLLPSEAWEEQTTLSPRGGRLSPRGKMGYEAAQSPMAEPRPPTQSGPSVYSTVVVSPRGVQAQESHRRFLRKEPQVPTEAVPYLSEMAPNPNSQFSPITKSSIVFDEEAVSEISEVCNRLRTSLARRGLKGWRALKERFEMYDNRRNGSIMRMDWERLHKTLGLGLSPEERELLFKTLSINRRDGAMDYRACLRQLKNTLPARRQELVAALYEHLKDETGDSVNGQTMKSFFDARSSPMCMLSRKDPQEATRDFYEAVDYFSCGGSFDPQAFADFFAMVSAIHEEDHEFGLITTATFGLPLQGDALA